VYEYEYEILSEVFRLEETMGLVYGCFSFDISALVKRCMTLVPSLSDGLKMVCSRPKVE